MKGYILAPAAAADVDSIWALQPSIGATIRPTAEDVGIVIVHILHGKMDVERHSV